MNKSDYILIGGVLILVTVIFGLFKLNESKDVNNAQVYYEDKLVMTIDLTKKEQKYTVDGFNGKVEILAGDGKIKVIQEDSPQHLCSKQGYIDKSYESIICLPNKIVIKLESDSEIDATVG